MTRSHPVNHVDIKKLKKKKKKASLEDSLDP